MTITTADKRYVRREPVETDLADEFLEVDQHALDLAWLDQPKLYHRYAVKLADARLEHASAKAALDVIEAELARDIRASPLNFGLEGRPTVDAVQGTVLLQKRYRQGLERLNSAKHAVDVLDAAIWALDHRKKSLENLVQLFLADYFSPPRAKRSENGSGLDDYEKGAIRRKGQRKAQP